MSKELNCPKCNGENGLRWNRDETFYKMDGYLDCRYCGKIIYKHKGAPARDGYLKYPGQDTRSEVMMINVRKV